MKKTRHVLFSLYLVKAASLFYESVWASAASMKAVTDKHCLTHTPDTKADLAEAGRASLAKSTPTGPQTVHSFYVPISSFLLFFPLLHWP